MPGFISSELSHAQVNRLFASKTEPEARLWETALMAMVDAELFSCPFTAADDQTNPAARRRKTRLSALRSSRKRWRRL